jgi:hypothetical protein
MSKLVCARCGYEPDWEPKDWGREPETHGHGPDPVCTNLINDDRFPKLPNGEQPQRICQGVLVPLQVARAAASRKGDA